MTHPKTSWQMAPDSKYIIGPGGTGGHVGETPIAISNPISASWLPDNVSAASRWIGLSGGPPNGHAVGGGTYFFDTTVNLTGYQPMTAEIQGLRTSADNALLAIFVNGHQVFAKADTFMGEFDEWQYLGSVGLGFFTSGLNTIQFEVENQPNTITDMGLRLEGSVVAAAVPEPSGLALAALAGPALLACRRRRSGARLCLFLWSLPVQRGASTGYRAGTSEVHPTRRPCFDLGLNDDSAHPVRPSGDIGQAGAGEAGVRTCG